MYENSNYQNKCCKALQAMFTLPRKGGQSKECKVFQRAFSLIYRERPLKFAKLDSYQPESAQRYRDYWAILKSRMAGSGAIS